MLAELIDIVGSRHVLVDPDVTGSYSRDWTGRFLGVTPAVVRPASTAEVAAVVAICAGAGTCLVPQGGNTGLVGGSVPLAGEVVLSVTRLSGKVDVDAAAGQATAAAGTTISALQQAAAASGWAYGVDWAARGTATVGGSIATNAGGLRFLRYGATRRQLFGVEAVLGDGSVISHLGGLAKDNTGYDLAGLLCGSEGTLGVVTAARLRLVESQPARTTALVAFSDLGAALHAVVGLRRGVVSLEAVELFVSSGLELVCAQLRLPPPFASPYPAYLVIEVAASTDPTAELAAAVDGLGGVVAVAAAGPEEPSRRAALWRYREGLTEALNLIGPPHKLDVTLPHRCLEAFVEEVPSVVSRVAADARTWLFGHAADGNLHVNVTGAAVDDQAVGDAVNDAVLSLVASLGGSISAEHGIGTAKRRWLHLNRSPAELAAMAAIKRSLDPAGILNPGVLLPPIGGDRD